MARSANAGRLLVVCAALEAVLFVLLSLSGGAFADFVLGPDSGYAGIGRHLVVHGSIPPNTRTIGYPLFCSLGYLIGGERYAVHMIIAMQLALNLLFAYGAWRLLERTVPESGPALRVTAFGLFFVAGLGMAVLVMTDFLAAFFFFAFLYGMLFWRRHASLLVSATALFFATLTRPTFTFVPVLVPFMAIAAGRFRTRVPVGHIAVFMAASLAATGVSVSYQYAWYGYPGPSSVVAFNIGTTMYHALAADRMTKKEYLGELEREAERRSGRPYGSLSKREQERFTRELFLEALGRRPARIAGQMALTAVKYLFVPVEALVSKLFSLAADEETYRAYGRVVLFIVCLPAWILSVVPPRGLRRNRRAYYAVVMLALVYVLGISAAAPGQGERIRFSVLAFMLPVMVMNADAVRASLARRGSRALTCR